MTGRPRRASAWPPCHLEHLRSASSACRRCSIAHIDRDTSQPTARAHPGLFPFAPTAPRRLPSPLCRLFGSRRRSRFRLRSRRFDAALPSTTPAAPILPREIDGHRGVKNRSERQRQGPIRSQAMKADDRPIGKGHAQPAGQAERRNGRRAMQRPADQRERRHEIEDEHRQYGENEQRPRMAEAGIGIACDHFPDVAQAGLVAQAAGGSGQAEPDAPGTGRRVVLDPLRERDVVDQAVVNRLDAADAAKRLAPHQDAAAVRGGFGCVAAG